MTPTTRISSSPPTRHRDLLDIANGIAEEYGFWLGDAFASGVRRLRPQGDGDHLARRLGAHQAAFPRNGRDIQTGDFTMVGSATCR